MLNTNKTSLQRVVKTGGRSRPRRWIRACSVSSTVASGVFFASGYGEVVLLAGPRLSKADMLRLRSLVTMEGAHKALLKVRDGIAWGRVFGSAR